MTQPNNKWLRPLSAAFALVAGALIYTQAKADAECCPNPATATIADIDYVPMNTADVHIPIYNEQVLQNGLSFEIDRRRISRLDFMFASTASYRSSALPVDNRPCPYINVPAGNVTRERLDRHRTRVTMWVNQDVVTEIARAGCVVGPRPAA